MISLWKNASKRQVHFGWAASPKELVFSWFAHSSLTLGKLQFPDLFDYQHYSDKLKNQKNKEINEK